MSNQSNQKAGKHRRHSYPAAFPSYNPGYSGYPVYPPLVIPEVNPNVRMVRRSVDYTDYKNSELKYISPLGPLPGMMMSISPPQLVSPTVGALSPAIRTRTPLIPSMSPIGPMAIPMTIPFGFVKQERVQDLLLIIKYIPDKKVDDGKTELIDAIQKLIDAAKTDVTNKTLAAASAAAAVAAAADAAAKTVADDAAKKAAGEKDVAEAILDAYNLEKAKLEKNATKGTDGEYFLVLSDHGNNWHGVFRSRGDDLKDAVFKQSNKSLHFSSGLSGFTSFTSEDGVNEIKMVLIEINEKNRKEFDDYVRDNLSSVAVYVKLDEITKNAKKDKMYTAQATKFIGSSNTEAKLDELFVNDILTNQSTIKGDGVKPAKVEYKDLNGSFCAWITPQ